MAIARDNRMNGVRYALSVHLFIGVLTCLSCSRATLEQPAGHENGGSQAISAALDSNDPEEVLEALEEIRGLGESGIAYGPRIVALAGRKWEDGYTRDGVLNRASLALSSIDPEGEQVSLQALRTLERAEDVNVRIDVLQLLRHVSESGGKERCILRGLRDIDPEVQSSAMSLIAGWKGPADKFFPLLREVAVKGPSSFVGRDGMVCYGSAEWAAELLYKAGPSGREVLVALLSDPKPERRYMGALDVADLQRGYTFPKSVVERAAKVLLECLDAKDSDLALRLTALRSLSELSTVADVIVPVLLTRARGLEADSYTTQTTEASLEWGQTVDILARLAGPGTPELVPVFIQILRRDDVDLWLKQAIIRGLGNIGEAAVPAIPVIQQLAPKYPEPFDMPARETLEKLGRFVEKP